MLILTVKRFPRKFVAQMTSRKWCLTTGQQWQGKYLFIKAFKRDNTDRSWNRKSTTRAVLLQYKLSLVHQGGPDLVAIIIYGICGPQRAVLPFYKLAPKKATTVQLGKTGLWLRQREQRKKQNLSKQCKKGGKHCGMICKCANSGAPF